MTTSQSEVERRCPGHGMTYETLRIFELSEKGEGNVKKERCRLQTRHVNTSLASVNV